MKRIAYAILLLSALSCQEEKLNVVYPPKEEDKSLISLAQVAKIMSALPLDNEHLHEVYSAVSSSSSNGYDEEYLMSDLFENPGNGVGSKTKSSNNYTRPLKDLFEDYIRTKYQTKAGGSAELAEQYLNALQESNYQIYWPYSEDWDGKTFPIITFDPGYAAESNYGYEFILDNNGFRVVDSLIVDESVAMNRPVWVINENDDKQFTPLILNQHTEETPNSVISANTVSFLNQTQTSQIVGKLDETKTIEDLKCSEDPILTMTNSISPQGYKYGDNEECRSLSIKSFKMLRNYDTWFGGASEFFIKCGAINGFKATTDEELKLYTPAVTDMMVVVKRRQLGLKVPINSLLLNEYTSQMDKIAFIIMEDDGGETKNWKCSAVVKIKSKSTGFELDIPYKDKDDIVWRGQLNYSFFADQTEVTQRFGDVEITFSLR